MHCQKEKKASDHHLHSIKSENGWRMHEWSWTVQRLHLPHQFSRLAFDLNLILIINNFQFGLCHQKKSTIPSSHWKLEHWLRIYAWNWTVQLTVRTSHFSYILHSRLFTVNESMFRMQRLQWGVYSWQFLNHSGQFAADSRRQCAMPAVHST